MAGRRNLEPLTAVVGDAINDTHCVVHLNAAKMAEHSLTSESMLLLKGDAEKQTVCRVLPRDDIPLGKMSMNAHIRNNLGVKEGSQIVYQACMDVRGGKRIYIEPSARLIYGSTPPPFDRNILEKIHKDYFGRPLHEHCTYLVGKCFEFEVLRTEPSPYCTLFLDTVICLGDQHRERSQSAPSMGMQQESFPRMSMKCTKQERSCFNWNMIDKPFCNRGENCFTEATKVPPTNHCCGLNSDNLLSGCARTCHNGLCKMAEVDTTLHRCLGANSNGVANCWNLPEVNADSNALNAFKMNMMLLYRQPCYTDFELRTKDRIFPIIRGFLAVGSPKFKELLTGTRPGGHLDIGDVDSITLDMMLEFLCAAVIPDLSWENAVKLYDAARKYEVFYLKQHCLSFLKSNIDDNNVYELVLLLFKEDDEDLKSVVLDFIFNRYDEIVQSQTFDEFCNQNPLAANKLMRMVLVRRPVIGP